NLRSLIIDGSGVGFNGIVFNTGASLTIQNTVIRKVTNQAISFKPNASSTLSISNSLIASTGSPGIVAVELIPTGSGAVSASLSHVEVVNNVYGLHVNGNSSTGVMKVSVSESVFANNGFTAVLAQSNTGNASISITLDRCDISYNNLGVSTNGGTNVTMWLTGSTIVGNSTGPWSINGTTVIDTFGDNSISGVGNAPLTLVNKQ